MDPPRNIHGKLIPPDKPELCNWCGIRPRLRDVKMCALCHRVGIEHSRFETRKRQAAGIKRTRSLEGLARQRARENERLKDPANRLLRRIADHISKTRVYRRAIALNLCTRCKKNTPLDGYRKCEKCTMRQRQYSTTARANRQAKNKRVATFGWEKIRQADKP